MEKIKINPEYKNQRLDVFLSNYLKISRKLAMSAIDNALVLVDNILYMYYLQSVQIYMAISWECVG